MTQAEEQVVRDGRVAKVDMKPEVVVNPCFGCRSRQGVLRKASYGLDADFGSDNGFRVVWFTLRFRYLNTVSQQGYAGSSRLGTK
jgi:hypothetical protein